MNDSPIVPYTVKDTTPQQRLRSEHFFNSISRSLKPLNFKKVEHSWMHHLDEIQFKTLPIYESVVELQF